MDDKMHDRLSLQHRARWVLKNATCQLSGMKFAFGINGLTPDAPGFPPYYLQVSFDAPCSKTGRTQRQRGRKWLLSEHMTDSEIVQTAFLAVLTAVEHEVRESFLFKNQPIFGPHFDVNALVEMAVMGNREARETLPPMRSFEEIARREAENQQQYVVDPAKVQYNEIMPEDVESVPDPLANWLLSDELNDAYYTIYDGSETDGPRQQDTWPRTPRSDA